MQPNNHVWSLTGLDLLLACVRLSVVKMMLGSLLIGLQYLVYVFNGLLDVIFHFIFLFCLFFSFFLNHIEKF